MSEYQYYEFCNINKPTSPEARTEMKALSSRTKVTTHRPLPDFIEEIYDKRFSKLMPDEVKTIEQLFASHEKKKKIKKQKKES